MSKKQQQYESDRARKDSASSIKILVTQPSGCILESDSDSEEEILKDRHLNPPLKKVSDPGLFDYSLVRNPVGFPVVMDYPNRTRTPSGNKVTFSVENINEEDLHEVCMKCKEEFENFLQCNKRKNVNNNIIFFNRRAGKNKILTSSDG